MRAAKIESALKNLILADAANKVRHNFGVWKCAQCDTEKAATVHQLRKTYCSKECMAIAYSSRMAGAVNPHYSNAGERICTHCGGRYKSYNKTRKFCTRACHLHSKPKVVKQPIAKRVVVAPKVKSPRVLRSTEIACIKCGASFRKYPSQTRLYCSYKCHLDSGGAFRAGLAASKATMKYGPRKDANHNEIFDELRKHCPVYDISTTGRGLPDGLAWINKAWHLFDVKNPNTGYGKRGLNAVQKKWIQQWPGGPVYLIYTADEASRFGRGDFTGIKREESALST